MNNTKFENTYFSNSEENKKYTGQTFTVLRQLNEADGINIEAGNVYMIKLQCGEIIEANENEICKDIS